MRPTFRLGLSVLAALAIVACRTEHSSRPTPDAAVTATGPFALPGAEQLESTSLARLSEAWAQRPPGYVPRTRNVHPDGAPKFVNRMFIEASPYVRQHAHDPVDFRPWGDEAFAEATRPAGAAQRRVLDVSLVPRDGGGVREVDNAQPAIQPLALSRGPRQV